VRQLCGGLQRVLHIFHDIKEQVFGALDFDLSELEGRRHDLRDEEPVELEEREKEGLGEGMLEYNRHMRTFHLCGRMGSSKEKEFVKAVVSLREIWADVKGFVAEYVPHHELSKAQGRKFAVLKSTDPATKEPTLRPRHARGG
jgi:hypothetical protein